MVKLWTQLPEATQAHDTWHIAHDRVSGPLAHQSQPELRDILGPKFSLMYDIFQPSQNAGFEILKQKQGKLQTCYPSAVSECCVGWVEYIFCFIQWEIQITFMWLENDIAVNLISPDLSPATDPDSDKSISLFFRPSTSKNQVLTP